MLAAGNGDALLLEYGDETSPRRILVDGGTSSAWEEGLRARIERLPAEQRRFELLVISHVDADHIDGALALLEDESLGVEVGDVWFNGWRHLPETPLESLGPVTGERLTDLLATRGLPWNVAFGGRAAGVRDEGPLPAVDLPDGLRITLLSPGAEQLARLKPVWREAIVEAGLDPERPRPEPAPLPPELERLGAEQLPDVAALAASPFAEDSAAANGSSIAFLVEHDGHAVLLGADAFPGVVQASLDRLLEERGQQRLALDALKVPHHGSRANVSPGLLERLDCTRFLFSSNGSRTRHPHPEGVARALAAGGAGSELHFNYVTKHNEVWAEEELRRRHGYEAVYPAEGESGLALELGEV